MTATARRQTPLAEAVDVLRRHGRHPSAFLALNRDTLHFGTPAIDGLIAYRPAGRRYVVQFGGVFAAPEDRERLLSAFINMAGARRRRVIAVQLRGEDAPAYRAHDFRMNQLGASYAVDLSEFSLRGKRFVKLRNKLARARRAGVEIHEVTEAEAASPDLQRRLAAIDSAWLRGKGRHTKELAFMIGERDGPGAAYRRLFTATMAGETIAYVSFCPVYGPRAGWLYDLTRRGSTVPPGVMELLATTAMQRFQNEGAQFFHLGFTPFAELARDHEVEDLYDRRLARLARMLADHGAALYPAASQAAYKRKWWPRVVEPEYIAFQGRVELRALWRLLRLTRAL